MRITKEDWTPGRQRAQEQRSLLRLSFKNHDWDASDDLPPLMQGLLVEWLEILKDPNELADLVERMVADHPVRGAAQREAAAQRKAEEKRLRAEQQARFARSDPLVRQWQAELRADWAAESQAAREQRAGQVNAEKKAAREQKAAEWEVEKARRAGERRKVREAKAEAWEVEKARRAAERAARPKQTCFLDFCDRVARSQKAPGPCASHYQQRRAGKPFTPIAVFVRTEDTCLVDACEKPIKARKRCRAHYEEDRLARRSAE